MDSILYLKYPLQAVMFYSMIAYWKLSFQATHKVSGILSVFFSLLHFSVLLLSILYW